MNNKMGGINTCEKESIYKLPDGNYLLIEKHVTLDDQEGGYDISFLKKEDAKDYEGVQEDTTEKMPIAYDGAVTLSMFQWAEEYAELVDSISTEVFSEFKFDIGTDENKISKMLDRIVSKIKKLQR